MGKNQKYNCLKIDCCQETTENLQKLNTSIETRIVIPSVSNAFNVTSAICLRSERVEKLVEIRSALVVLHLKLFLFKNAFLQV